MQRIREEILRYSEVEEAATMEKGLFNIEIELNVKNIEIASKL